MKQFESPVDFLIRGKLSIERVNSGPELGSTISQEELVRAYR